MEKRVLPSSATSLEESVYFFCVLEKIIYTCVIAALIWKSRNLEQRMPSRYFFFLGRNVWRILTQKRKMLHILNAFEGKKNRINYY